ncbi:MAG: hypothetical protein AAGH15_13450 [Myxococcota bacterium]
MKHVAVLLPLLALGLLGACQRDARPPETPEAARIETPAPPPFDPMAFLPAETFALVRLDVSRIIASPYFEWAQEIIDREAQDEPEKTEAFLALVRSMPTAYVALVPGEYEPELGLVLFQTTLPGPEFHRHFVTLTDEEDIVPTTVGGLEAYGDDQGTFVHLEDTWWAVGETEKMPGYVMSPGRAPALADPRWTHAHERVALPAPMVDALVLGTEAGRRMLLDSPLGPDAQKVEALALEIDATNGVQAHFVLMANEPELPQRLVGLVNAQIQEGMERIPPFIPVRDILNRTTVVAEGNDFVFEIDVPDETVRQVYGMARGFLGLLGSPPDQATEAPPAP